MCVCVFGCVQLQVIVIESEVAIRLPRVIVAHKFVTFKDVKETLTALRAHTLGLDQGLLFSSSSLSAAEHYVNIV